MNINKQIKITFVMLLLAIFIFGNFHNIDIYIQDFLYDFNQNNWILHKQQKDLKFLLYDFVRVCFFIFILFFCILLCNLKNKYIKEHKKNLLIFFLATSFTFLVMHLLKSTTNIPCPNNIFRYNNYNGMPITAIWEKYPVNCVSLQKHRCWPAGHASIGFVFLSTFFLFKQKRYKYTGVVASLIFGWIIGIYKMAIGDHFFSHNVISMLLAWLVALLVVKYINVYDKYLGC